MQNSAPLFPIFKASRFFIIALLVLLVGACQPAEPLSEIKSEAFSAARNNDVAKLVQYLEQGVDPDAMNEDGDSLLYVASGARGGFEVAQFLIASGADLNLISREGRTALHTAAAWCNSQIVALLLDAGARTDIANSEGKIAMDVVCSRPPQRREQVLALFFQAQSDS
ncbi:MAG: ankyrin repeat domain-containing protein [Devosiaceae bacterium]|nr:ankyrin repeat domain-containing protein [Devosiaceae bacterium]